MASPEPIHSPHHIFSSFPISSSRDESHSTSSPSFPFNPLQPSNPPTTTHLNPAYTKYAVQQRHEIFPGILQDGTITVRHKFVDLFLSHVHRTPNDRYSHRLEPDNFFGERPKPQLSVAHVLSLHEPLSNKQNDAIFALAALKVFYRPHHPAHFTFWGKESCKKTAEKVQSVLDMNPCPIASPVGWLGIPENIWLVDGMQALCFPPRPAAKRVNGMTLRKRKARELKESTAATASSSLERPRPKRVRTATKAASQLAEDQLNAVLSTPIRQSARLASTATPQRGSSLLPAMLPVHAAAAAAPTTEATSKETKVEQIATSALVHESESALLLTPSSSSSAASQPLTSSLTEVNLTILANLVSEISPSDSRTSQTQPAPPTSLITSGRTSGTASVPAGTAKRRQTSRQASTPVAAVNAAPTRRSARQPKPTAKKIAPLVDVSGTTTPVSVAHSLPDEEHLESVEGDSCARSGAAGNAGDESTETTGSRKGMRRARSSSSSVKSMSMGSEVSSSTAVSEVNSAGGETAVEDSPEFGERKLSGEGGKKRKVGGGGRKRKLDEVEEEEKQEDDEEDKEEEEETMNATMTTTTRSSGRKRRPTAAAAAVTSVKTKTKAAQERGQQKRTKTTRMNAKKI